MMRKAKDQKRQPWLDLSRDRAHFLSGVIAGAVSSYSLHPLHLFQTRLSVQDNYRKYDGIVSGLRSIYSTEGIRGMYQGAVPAMIGSAVSWGLYMYFYDVLKRKWSHRQSTMPSSVVPSLQTLDSARKQQNALSPLAHLSCSYLAGTTTCLITNPIWVIKTRMELQTFKDKSNYRSLPDAVRTIARDEGIRYFGFYRGLVPSLFGVTHGAVLFVTYEELKILIKDYTKEDQLTSAQGLVAGAASKVLASAITHPYTVCKARLQQRPGHGTHYNGMTDVISRTFRNEGFRGFYKGCLVSVIRVTPGAAITFAVFETMKPLLHRGSDTPTEENE